MAAEQQPHQWCETEQLLGLFIKFGFVCRFCGRYILTWLRFDHKNPDNWKVMRKIQIIRRGGKSNCCNHSCIKCYCMAVSHIRTTENRSCVFDLLGSFHHPTNTCLSNIHVLVLHFFVLSDSWKLRWYDGCNMERYLCGFSFFSIRL